MESNQLRTLAAALTLTIATGAPHAAASQDIRNSLASASQLIADNGDTALNSPQAGYCPGTSTRDIWDDTEWIMFSRSLSSCDANGNAVTVEGQLHLTDTWDPSYRWIRTYDGAGNITEWIHQLHNGTNYENSQRDINIYHASGLIETALDQVWDGSTWVDEDRRSYDFDGDGNRIGYIDEDWDGSQWVAVERETSEITSGNSGTTLLEEWDGSAWIPVELTTTDYTDPQNYSISVQEWDGSAWVNTERFAQSGSDRTEESWNGTQWEFERKQTLTYDGSDRLVDLTEQTWDGSQWVNDYRAVYVFDASTGLRTEFRLDTWDGSAWANDHKQLYSFDANGNQTEDLILSWNGTEWENLQRTTTTWQELGGVGVEDESALTDGYRLLQNYPNPADANTTIRFELPAAADVSLTAYDVLGRQVGVFFSGSRPAGTHEVVANVGALPNGTYFYRLESGRTSVTRRMIVIN